ncbi:hypothetical protein [Rheinheimera pacifica]|uniref:hypothetical protein n=1 Tax=Rheinheimera pacifica TaxID=173990 RepID=UPI002ED87841
MTRLSSTEYLTQCVTQLNDACRWLQRSYDKCQSFDLSQALSDDQYDDLENLSSRFARVTDILLNKVYRALDTAELMQPGSLIDTVNRAVKRGVLESPDIARTVKDIRNEIVHEYTVEDLKQLQEEVIAYTKVLLQLVVKVNDYVSAEF